MTDHLSSQMGSRASSNPRSPSVHVLVGEAGRCGAALEEDFAALDAVEQGAPASVRVWSCAETAVVIGVGQNAAAEVDLEYCQRNGIAVLRRGSGGGSVVVGPGTLQYAFALPYSASPALADIAASKAFCNEILIGALVRAGVSASLRSDPGGDLKVGDRKAAGLALKRKRRAMLLHGTILLDATIDVVARALRHPSREPEYRGGRSHESFLINLGALDQALFAQVLTESAAAMAGDAPDSALSR